MLIRHRPSMGFTLIELLVVLAIVATLLSIAYPRYHRSVDVSRDTALRQTLATTRSAIDQFAADRGVLPESLDILIAAGYLRQLPVDPITERADTWLLLPAPQPDRPGVYDLKSGAGGSGGDGVPYGSY